MPKKPTRIGHNSWQRWRDPREAEKDFERWTQAHRDLNLLRASEEIQRLAKDVPEGAPVVLIAARTGLSQATVSKYLRKRDMGKRGPLLTTFIALRNMAKDD